MKPYVLIVLVMLVALSQKLVYAQAETCLPPRFLGGQRVRVVGSVDAGGLPFRDLPSLSQPVNGFIPIDTVVSSKQTRLCTEGRNWYTVLYTPPGEESLEEVWVMDGNGAAYWLEPTPVCAAGRTQLVPTYPSYSMNLIVDRLDEQARILHFSLELFQEASETYEQHYFNLDLNTGILTEEDYWYRDIITREFTDRLGITEQVFGAGEDFSQIFVSPDREQVLYTTTGRPAGCTDNCFPETTVWITDRAGADPIPLITSILNRFSRVIWEADGRILLSAPHPLVYSQDTTLIVCADGSCAGEAEDILLAGRSDLPFTRIQNTPTFSPDNEWMAVVARGAEPYAHGNPTAGFILNREDKRYIQLPYNGDVAAPIEWLDDDTILYPVMGIGGDGGDYGLPHYFYEQNALWEIDLDFDNLTYRIRDRVTSSEGQEWYEQMFDIMPTHHVMSFGLGAVIYSYTQETLALYCFSYG